jgi:hypothetical protein
VRWNHNLKRRTRPTWKEEEDQWCLSLTRRARLRNLWGTMDTLSIRNLQDKDKDISNKRDTNLNPPTHQLSRGRSRHPYHKESGSFDIPIHHSILHLDTMIILALEKTQYQLSFHHPVLLCPRQDHLYRHHTLHHPNQARRKGFGHHWKRSHWNWQMGCSLLSRLYFTYHPLICSIMPRNSTLDAPSKCHPLRYRLS